MVLSCKEPLVLQAIIQVMGVKVVVDAVAEVLHHTQSLLGKADVSKGALFQQLTAYGFRLLGFSSYVFGPMNQNR